MLFKHGNFASIPSAKLLLYLSLTALTLIWQIASLDKNSPTNCMNRFKANGYLGLLIFLALWKAA